MPPPTFNERVFLVLVLLVFFFAGCATTPKIHSKVTVFHNLPREAQITKYAFLPLKDQKDSLEYQAYQKMIRSELTQRGYEETEAKDASVLIEFNYLIGPGAEKIGTMPIIGQTGVSSSKTTGNLTTLGNIGSYSSSTTYTPSYGIVGSQSFSYAEYPRVLVLMMFDNLHGKKGNAKVLYQGQVFSRGTSSQLAEVVPAMIRSLFKEFPGESGSTHNILLPMKNYYQQGNEKKERSLRKR